MPIACGNCGGSLGQDDVFCGSCGTPCAEAEISAKPHDDEHAHAEEDYQPLQPASPGPALPSCSSP
jgi:uncharacterized membrane protein YvbJ